mmetsp:Transcript_20519/g.51963  ORF Transcript_20519/g.51963 Transcript_20519/m.51963 type:complete len:501 (+) Transcript_20519:155-1657(+)
MAFVRLSTSEVALVPGLRKKKLCDSANISRTQHLEFDNRRNPLKCSWTYCPHMKLVLKNHEKEEEILKKFHIKFQHFIIFDGSLKRSCSFDQLDDVCMVCVPPSGSRVLHRKASASLSRSCSMVEGRKGILEHTLSSEHADSPLVSKRPKKNRVSSFVSSSLPSQQRKQSNTVAPSSHRLRGLRQQKDRTTLTFSQMENAAALELTNIMSPIEKDIEKIENLLVGPILERCAAPNPISMIMGSPVVSPSTRREHVSPATHHPSPSSSRALASNASASPDWSPSSAFGVRIPLNSDSSRVRKSGSRVSGLHLTAFTDQVAASKSFTPPTPTPSTSADDDTRNSLTRSFSYTFHPIASSQVSSRPFASPSSAFQEPKRKTGSAIEFGSNNWRGSDRPPAVERRLEKKKSYSLSTGSSSGRLRRSTDEKDRLALTMSARIQQRRSNEEGRLNTRRSNPVADVAAADVKSARRRSGSFKPKTQPVKSSGGKVDDLEWASVIKKA